MTLAEASSIAHGMEVYLRAAGIPVLVVLLAFTIFDAKNGHASRAHVLGAASSLLGAILVVWHLLR